MFIDTAWAQSGTSAGGGDMLMSLAPLILLFLIFYFLLIRPQQKRAKAHQQMLGEIGKGDLVVLGGGLYGKVVVANDDSLEVDLGMSTVLVQRGSISATVQGDAAKGIKLPTSGAKSGTKSKAASNAKPKAKKATKANAKDTA